MSPEHHPLGLSYRKAFLNHWLNSTFIIIFIFWGHRPQMNWGSLLLDPWCTLTTLLVCVTVELTCIPTIDRRFVRTGHMSPMPTQRLVHKRFNDLCWTKLNESPFYKWVNWEAERWEMTCPSLHISKERD